MLEKIIVRSFKSIVDLELSLGHVNVFIGANGSGKSNILEALGVLSAAAFGIVDDESLQRRGVRPGVPKLYKSAFSGRRITPHIFFEAHAKSARYTVSLNNSLENPSSAWQYNKEEMDSGGKIILKRGIGSASDEARNNERGLAALQSLTWAFDDPARILHHLLEDFAIFAPNTLILRGLVADPQTRLPVGIWGGRLASAMRELTSIKNNHLALIDEYLDEVFGPH